MLLDRVAKKQNRPLLKTADPNATALRKLMDGALSRSMPRPT